MVVLRMKIKGKNGCVPFDDFFNNYFSSYKLIDIVAIDRGVSKKMAEILFKMINIFKVNDKKY